MPVDFFDREVNKVQQRFNETFGVLDVCDLQMRQKTILSIINMMRLKDKIMSTQDNKNIKEDRSKFVKTRDALNSIFNQIDQELNERRNHANRNIIAGNNHNGASLIQRGCRNLPELRKRLQGCLAQGR